jgi:galactitol-specific phosphotransferase system IIC component
MALIINLLVVIRVTPEGSACTWGLSTVSFFFFFFFLILNILCYTLFMETKTEEVANWFGHAKFTFAQLKLGGASQV